VAETTTNIQCLLCSSGNIARQDELTGSELRALWRVVGREFTSTAFAPIGETTRVSLFRCEACGFRFYDPALTGSGKFYEELMAGEYYAENRPEFGFTLRFANLRSLKTVLDVGGGEGGFLDLARQNGLQTFGVELNQAAAARAAAKGHRTINKSLHDVNLKELDGGVDLLTLYQVVEHVPDPLRFVRDATRLVRDNGFIAISVPNEYRICGLIPYDAANWPPHHISRWREKDLRRLAENAGLRVVAHGSDMLFGAAFETFIPLHNRLAAAIGRGRYPIDKKGALLLSFFYRKLGLKYIFPKLGLSIYIIAQKSGESRSGPTL
jgi:2-polyprenyl-3-methyl-5-hydroxy-6-metoxy-1,4-benzoquinol methylase